MRIHSNQLTEKQLWQALKTEQAAGRIAPSVRFKTLTTHTSQSHARAFEVQLESTHLVKGDGRRRGNSGSYGAMNDGCNYAATYDEWGWFIARLFTLAPDTVIGSVKNPMYADQDDFDTRTGLTYHPEILLPLLNADSDPYPYLTGKSKVGRRGFGRVSGDVSGWQLSYCTYAPRTAQEYARFANLTPELSRP